MYSACNDLTAGFPHSEICGSKLVCQLPAAYRKLLRPSSPVIAKASTICTYSLDPITLSPCSLFRLGKKLKTYKEVLPGYGDISRLCQTSYSDLRRRPGRYNHNPCCLHTERTTRLAHGSAPANQHTSSELLKNSRDAGNGARKNTSKHGHPTLASAFATRNSRQTTKMVEVNGIEPMTPCLQSRCSPS